MADDVTLQSATPATAPAGTKISTDEDATNGHVQRVKLAESADGSSAHIPADTTNGLLVNVKQVQGVVHVDDNASTLSVDDGGGSLTVDGTVGVSGTVPVDSELTTADLDSGAGTDTRAVVGIVKAKSGGAVNVSDTDPLPVSDAGGSLTVDGPLTDAQLRATRVPVDASGVAVPITDNSGSLTVDAPVGTPLWVRLSDGSAAFVGQKAMASSVPVVVASDQSAVPISAASLPSHPVTNAGTFAIQDSDKVVDNAGFTDGTTKLQPIGYVFDEVAGTALTENDAAAARIDSKRGQVAVLEDATTRGQRAAISAAGRLSVDASGVAVPITDNAGTLTVDAPVGTPVFVRLSDGSVALVGQKVMASSLPVALASDQSALPITDNAGSLTVDNAGTFAVQESQVITDNAGFTDGTSKLFPVGYIFDESAGTALTENDAAAGRVNANRAQVSVIEDDATRGRRTTVTAANALKVDGSAVTQPTDPSDRAARVNGLVRVQDGTGLTINSFLDNADAVAAGNQVLGVGARKTLFNGTNWDRERGNFNTTTGDTGAKTTNFLGAAQTNYNARGAIITLVVGAVSGTFTTFQTGIHWSFDGGTTWLPLTAAGANITTPASGNTIVWIVYPGSGAVTPAATGGVNAATQTNVAALALPRTWRFAMSLAGTTPSLTITSVNINYIL